MKKSPVWAWVKEYLFWIEKPYIYIYTVEIREKHFYFFFAYLFVTQFVHVNVHFKGFVYWMYEIILVYILDTWSSYVLAIYIYICICCWKFLIWPLARFGLFFSFSAFFSRRMQQSPIFLLSLIFCQKNWNKEAPCNTEKPRLRMETYPVLFWLVFFTFLRIVFLHLESFMLIKKMEP